jgi:hypothetical protein
MTVLRTYQGRAYGCSAQGAGSFARQRIVSWTGGSGGLLEQLLEQQIGEIGQSQ